jgi:DNA repair protein RecO (recombination protein O)
MYTKDSAICLKTVDYSETSQIVTFFTERNGKISAIAKGSRRKKSSFESPLEPLSQGSIVFTSRGKNLVTLAEFNQGLQFRSLARNFFAYNSALFTAELIIKFTEDYDPHPRLYNQCVEFLNRVSQNPEDKSLVLSKLILFQLGLLKEAGLLPLLKLCANCKASFDTPAFKQVYFSSSANGFVCRDCENSFPEKVKVSLNTARCFNNLKKLQSADVDVVTLTEMEKILIQHLTYINGKEFRTARYLVRLF